MTLYQWDVGGSKYEATLGTLIDLNTSLGMDQWKGGTYC